MLFHDHTKKLPPLVMKNLKTNGQGDGMILKTIGKPRDAETAIWR